MAELPRIYLIQASDAPQHSGRIESILTNLVTERRIAKFIIQKPTDDLISLKDVIVPGDMMILVLTEAIQSIKSNLTQTLKEYKNQSVKVAEIVIDHIPYENEFITFPEDLRPIRSRDDMDATWNRIGSQLREIFPRIPEPVPPKPSPEWKKYAIIIAAILIAILGYFLFKNVGNTKSEVVKVPAREMPEENGSFSMPIKDVFSISGRGTVVTGIITTGSVKEGQPLVITGDGVELQTMATGITVSNKDVAGAQAGENVGILLRGIVKDQVRTGMILRSANSSELYVVVLQEIGSNKVQVIKIVREFTGLGLKESKDLVESAPTKIWRTTSKAEAKKISEELRRFGAKVTVE